VCRGDGACFLGGFLDQVFALNSSQTPSARSWMSEVGEDGPLAAEKRGDAD